MKTISFQAISLQPYTGKLCQWQHFEKEIKEVPKGVFNFCLQENVRKEIIRNAETDLFFKGIDREELGVVDLPIEVATKRQTNCMQYSWKMTPYEPEQHAKKWNIVISSSQRSLLKECDH